MNIQKITIRNILGVKEMTFDAGRFNSIVGPNGSGKTSVLEAIRTATRCGHDATLLRKGEAEGEVVLVLDDGRSIRRRVTADQTKSDLIDAGGKRTAKPVDGILALSDALSVNPISFLRADEKERATVLLKSMPIKVDVDKLSKISGVAIDAAQVGNALALIENVRQQVYNDRTGTNRAQKEKDATINQLKAAMPAEAADAPKGDEAELRAELDAAQAAYDAEIERIANKLGAVRNQRDGDLMKLREEAAQKKAAIDAQLAVDIKQRQDDHQQIEERAAAQRQITVDAFLANKNRLQQAIFTITQDAENATRRKQTAELVEKLSAEFVQLGEDAEAQTAALAAIDAYKLELLNSLPIRGLTVSGDGKVMRDGVPFDRLNSAQQVQIAVEIAKLRAGTLGVICVDGIELLDTHSFEEFRQQALASGLQMFVTRVSDEEFGVEVDD